jgi:hypothetical protein
MWTYEGREVTEDEIEQHTGFVYIITNLTNNKKYVGKKLFKSTRTKTIKGKRKKVKSDSDWRDYYGSNAILKEDVKRLGPDSFKREILKLCKSKGTANYWEMKYQIQFEVLERPDEYYNEWIIVKVHRSHIKKD